MADEETSPAPIRVQVEAMQEEQSKKLDEETPDATSTVPQDDVLHDFALGYSENFSDSDTETEMTALNQDTLPEIGGIDITENEIKRLMGAYPFGLCNVAMPFQYFVSGFIGAIITGILYGILIGRMSVDANHYVASQAVVLVPWGFKCCVGFMSDNFALLGRRRVYYCVLGHIVILFTFVGLAIFYEVSN